MTMTNASFLLLGNLEGDQQTTYYKLPLRIIATRI